MFALGDRVRVLGPSHVAHDVEGVNAIGTVALACGKITKSQHLVHASSRDPRCKSCVRVEAAKQKKELAAPPLVGASRTLGAPYGWDSTETPAPRVLEGAVA